MHLTKEIQIFFQEVNKVLGDLNGQIILEGDFNQVLDPILQLVTSTKDVNRAFEHYYQNLYQQYLEMTIKWNKNLFF